MLSSSPFSALPAHVDLPAAEHEILAFWDEQRIFARSIEQTEGKPPWVFYEGPPTANGRPGTHHIEARVFKDVFPRYRTMKGYHVPRQAGWDCHGLPVEIAVEKELGLSGKPDIEKVGIETFNARCRESVQRYVGEFEEMTQRLGYWVDMSQAYWTMSPEYVDSVWWALKKISDAGLLVQDHRVAPYCPRCGTALSDHEVAQGYETITDPSVYVRFPLVDDLDGVVDVELLIWTTTPWTLVSNTAVAVNPEVDYVLAEVESGRFVVAEHLLAAVLGEDARVLRRIRGADLEHVRYQRPFDLVEVPDAHFVVTADYVTTEDGTGLVHQSPAFGADDLTTCRRYGLPVVNPIAPDGHFLPETPMVGGMFFKDADAPLVDDLKQRGLLFRKVDFEHSYPHCWRCHTPLMYYAQLSWYIRTTERAGELHRENERTNWHPDHIKHGRFGDWLDNNIDWALSRSRYWGTPLPVWACPQGHPTCVGSRAELGELAGRDLTDLDPHRPFVDSITFPCRTCGKESVRVPEVIDAWFDSGSMPFAAIGYPHVPGSVEKFESRYPAQFICEAIDQTRGWFYTLMAVGTLVFDRSSFENVVCLGHIVAEDGRKMSKHLGNVILPMPFMEKHGADALRWFMLFSGSPWSPRRIGDGPIEEIVRKVLLTYWNTASFFTLYASTGVWEPGSAAPVAERPVIDRWVLAELNQLVRDVDAAMEAFDTANAGRALASFIDDLSNWYVRRTRSRFWAADPDALSTLHECLDVLTRLLAPFVPFVTERVWQAVVRPGQPNAAESVHLSGWPDSDETRSDDRLRSDMAVTRQLVEIGRSARKASKIRIRQPLSRALIATPDNRALPAELVAEISDELNVREVSALSGAGEIVNVTVKPNFRELGKRFARRTPLVAKAVTAADQHDLARRLSADGRAELTVEGDQIEITAGDVTMSEVPREGWTIASHQAFSVALDTMITRELARAGLVREAIRLIQSARKEADLAVTDRIELWWRAEGELAVALDEGRDELAAAVLATRITTLNGSGHEVEPPDPGDRREDAELGLSYWLRRVDSETVPVG